MRAYANAFLVLFAVDAVVTLASFALGGPAQAGLAFARGPLAVVVSLASLPLYVLMGVHPGLRWRIFLPPCLFVGWVSMGAMPLPLGLGASQAGLALGALQVAFAALAFGLCRQANGGRGWLLGEGALRGPVVSGRTALGFTALNLLVILPASLAYLAFSAAVGVEHVTEGYVEVRGDGIHLAHREVVRDGQRVHLVAMMHIGDAAFYEELAAELPRAEAVVLVEGVADEAGLLSEGLSYGNVAAAVGLVEQPPLEDLVESPALGGEGRSFRHADVDASAFSPETTAFLTGVGRLLGSETLVEALAAYADLTDMSADTATRTLAALKHDLLDLRNAHLLGEIEQALRDHDQVVVPWGALHLPAIEASLRARGFVPDGQTARRVVRW